MMQHIPASMQQPSDTYELVGSQSLVGTVGDGDEEGELPDAESPVQVRCACSCHHDRIEVLSVRLFEQRTERDVNKRDDNRSDNIHEVHQQIPSALPAQRVALHHHPYSHPPERCMEERHQSPRLSACVPEFVLQIESLQAAKEFKIWDGGVGSLDNCA
jgi:hypothetical protein